MPTTPLTFRKLRQTNVKRCTSKSGFNQHLNEWSDSDWLMAALGELGELANKLKKRKRGEHIPVKDIEDEIADVVCYLDLFSASEGISLEKIIPRKFNEVSDRKNCKIKL